ncbi:hypothetical protein V6N11_043668 [Hibiscus sabdariffa]|uniref:Cysteine-rich receptor-like protein kinase 42 n=1 Tax=Hibiscus sabdariffa TaxID=183260 RepID=A0ABR2RCW8_9ROSI
MDLVHFSGSEESYWRWVFMFIFSSLFSTSISEPRISNSTLLCGKFNPLNGTNFVPSFVKEMRGLSEAINARRFATYHLDSAPPIYALAQCHRDLSQTECLLCFAVSRTKIPRCLPFNSARIFLDGCFLRYENYSFYRESVSSSLDQVVCSSDDVAKAGEDSSTKRVGLFGKKVGYAVSRVTKIALRDGGFGALAVDGVFALAQCWESVPFEGCRECLQKAAMAVKGCLPKAEGRGLNTGCYLRYSTEKFFNERGETEHNHGFPGIEVIISIVSATSAFIMLSVAVAYVTYARFSKRKRELENLGQISKNFDKSGLTFKYETLEKATDYFSLSRKLGQGGADEEKAKHLKWKHRFEIIVGTAEGLAHLHGGGSETRIIHRDIKSSNVLLDELLNPKIADFGLVRCLAPDKSHLSTGVAGTLNTTFSKDSASLLQTVWTLYKLNRLAEVVDACIRDEISVKVAPNYVLQVGLLCTQASVALRPSMAEVVEMLTDKDCEIPVPNQPPFLNANVKEQESSTKSYNSSDSFISNAARKIQGSGTLSESSRTGSSDEASKTPS